MFFYDKLNWKFPLMIQQNNVRDKMQKIDPISNYARGKFRDNNESDFLMYNIIDKTVSKYRSENRSYFFREFNYKMRSRILDTYITLKGKK